MDNLLGGPPPTHLPEDHPDTAARAGLATGATVRDLVRRHPASSLLWALLAEEALAGRAGIDGKITPPDPVAAYAYARTG